MSKPDRDARETMPEDDLRDEYRFDDSAAKPNRFAARADASNVVVVLDDDLARVFRTPESVKAVLRALIRSMPDLPPEAERCGQGR